MAVSKISVAVATSVGLGAIIGAGIFTLSGSAIALAGSQALLAFVLVGIVAVLIALELGEMGSLMPKLKGAAYSYISKAFGSELGFISGILLYLSYSTAIAAIALGFGAYLGDLFGFPAIFDKLFSIALIFVLALVNLIGIKKAVKADFGLVIIKIVILIIFIVFAMFFAFGSKGFSFSQNLISLPAQNGIGRIFEASVAIFFAYSGFQTISTFTSDIKRGARGAVTAIVAAVLISIVLYVFVAIALISLVPASHYTINADPLAFALNFAHAPQYIAKLVDIGALVATASATLAMILSASRISYQISSDGLLPKILKKYNRKKDVAANGVILSAVIGVIMLFSGNIYIIAAISNFGLLFSYLLLSFALIQFRRLGKRPSFKTPFYPYLSIIAIVGTLAFLIGMPKEALVIGVIIILVLIVLYYTLLEIEEKNVPRVRLFK